MKDESAVTTRCNLTHMRLKRALPDWVRCPRNAVVWIRSSGDYRNNSERGRMRSLNVPGILMFVLALDSIATAGENKMGDGEVSQVTFIARFALEQRC
jgi:hypothetical protein